MLSKEIGELIRKYGNKNNTQFRLGIESGNFIVPGENFAEEYDDLGGSGSYEKPSFPCKIDYIAIESDSLEPWFHMYTNYASHFPLASNDKYNLSAVADFMLVEIKNFIIAKNISKEISEERLIELNRVEWLKIAKKQTKDIFKWKKNDDGTYCECDLRYLVDTIYCCARTDKEIKENGVYKNRQDIYDTVMKTINNKTLAFYLMVIHVNYDGFYDCAYLGFQTTERYERWRNIAPYIWDKVEENITQEEFDYIIKQNPKDLLDANFKLK